MFNVGDIVFARINDEIYGCEFKGIFKVKIKEKINNDNYVIEIVSCGAETSIYKSNIALTENIVKLIEQDLNDYIMEHLNCNAGIDEVIEAAKNIKNKGV